MSSKVDPDLLVWAFSLLFPRYFILKSILRQSAYKLTPKEENGLKNYIH